VVCFGQCCELSGASCCVQQMELTWHRDLRPRKRTMCFDVSQSIAKAPVILYTCHGMQGNQWFKYNVVSVCRWCLEIGVGVCRCLMAAQGVTVMRPKSN